MAAELKGVRTELQRAARAQREAESRAATLAAKHATLAAKFAGADGARA